MRKILFGVVLTLFILYIFRSCQESKAEAARIEEHTALIQQQLKNVSKLVVTEGYFSEVLSYEKSKAFFGDMFSLQKKALVVVNARVSIAFDLSKLTYEINDELKTLTILTIPEEEITISPELEYYDIQDDYLNRFEADDYNNINKEVKAIINKRIEKSNLKSNAKDRLISELSKLYVLTSGMGWTLIYKDKPINESAELAF